MSARMSVVLALGAITAAAGCGPSGSRLPVKMVPPRVAGAVDVGALPGAQPLTLVLGVKTRNQALLDETIAETRADRSRLLTPSDFADRFAVSTDGYAQLIDWATANGFQIVRATASRTTLTLVATPSSIERAFGMHIRVYRDANGVFYAPDREPDLTSGVLGNVSSIVGFSNAGHWWSHRRPRAAPPEAIPTPLPTNGYGMAGLRTLYNAPAALDAYAGAGERIAILGVGAPALDTDTLPLGTNPHYNTPQLYDLALYVSPRPVPTSYKQIQVGASGTADPGDDATYGENTLDAEMVLTFAPAANVDHVLVTNNEYGLFSDGIAFIVNDPVESTAHAVSLSYGLCESFELSSPGDAPPAFPVLNVLFQQALTEGQQWFVAAGDSGTDDCGDGTNDPVTTVDWPGSSPYVFSVGGTEIDAVKVKKVTTYHEEAWGGGGYDYGGGGGGASQAFAKPSWQVGVTVADGARDVPDISALAGDPGIDEIWEGTDSPSVGTSCSAPMWAGIWGLVDGASNGGRGFSQGPLDLYAHAPAGGIVDVSLGTNDVGTVAGGFPAVAGYDLATGRGVPNVSILMSQTGWK